VTVLVHVNERCYDWGHGFALKAFLVQGAVGWQNYVGALLLSESVSAPSADPQAVDRAVLDLLNMMDAATAHSRLG